jgi:pimeloyl-ACP methyl ester carboxylesterase
VELSDNEDCVAKTMTRTITAFRREGMNRRQILQGAGALLIYSAAGNVGASPDGEGELVLPKPARNQDVEYGQDTLPAGVRSRRVDTNNGLTMHVLEAGFETRGRRCVVLLHGFPELAYTWRHQLLPLAAAGFHVIAPDLRGYGRSVSTAIRFDDDLLPYSALNRVRDILGLVRALGYEKVAAIVGHDWGGPTAQWCSLVRPDVFHSVVSLSTPFFGSPTLPPTTSRRVAAASGDIDKDLAALPRPRKHYSTYSATRDANENMWHAPQGVHDLLRALYYFKSADFKGNRPFPLKSWSAPELAKMPTYYIMDLGKGMAETVAAEMPSKAQINACKWLTEDDLAVYAAEYTRTGFQGGLNYYRVGADPSFSGRTVDVPAFYIGGDSEWAVYQSPGAFEAMRTVCTHLQGVHIVTRAGHSIPEEQPEQVNKLLLGFLRGSRPHERVS